MEFKIFISYSTKDKDFFNIPSLAQFFESEMNATTWYCQRDAKENWVDYMNEKIPLCDFFLLFCTPNSVQSPYVKDEWQAAYTEFKDNRSKIIPVFYEEEYIPTLLKSFGGYKFNIYDMENAIDGLVKFIIDRSNSLKIRQKESIDAKFDTIKENLRLLKRLEGITNILLIHNETGLPILGYLDMNLYTTPQLLSGFMNAMTNVYPELMQEELNYVFFKGNRYQIILLKDDIYSLSLIFTDKIEVDKLIKDNMSLFNVIREGIYEKIEVIREDDLIGETFRISHFDDL